MSSPTLQLIPTSHDREGGLTFLIGYAGLGPVTCTGYVRLLNHTKKPRYFTSLEVELRGTMKTSFYVPVYPYFFSDSRIASRKSKLIPLANAPARSGLPSSFLNRNNDITKFVVVNPGEYKDVTFFITFVEAEARALRPTVECYANPEQHSQTPNGRPNSTSSSSSALDNRNEDFAYVRYTLHARATSQGSPPTQSGRKLSFFGGLSSMMQTKNDEVVSSVVMKQWDVASVKELTSELEPHSWSDKSNDLNYAVSVNRTIVKPGGVIVFNFDVRSVNKGLWVESVRFVIEESTVIKGFGPEKKEKMQVDNAKNVVVWEARAQSQDKTLKPQEARFCKFSSVRIYILFNRLKSIYLDLSGDFGIIEIEHAIKIIISLKPRLHALSPNAQYSPRPNSQYGRPVSQFGRPKSQYENSYSSQSSRPKSHYESNSISSQSDSRPNSQYGSPFSSPSPSFRGSVVFPEEPVDVELSIPLLVVPFNEDECRIVAQEYPELVWGTEGPGGPTRGGTLPRYSPIQVPQAAVRPNEEARRRFSFYPDVSEITEEN
ncbi:hypothetical protein HK096_005176 [Nowakowskiella sp. JEL0078]|nr:hypothetical protein HK096_005176 [Nowakowskiella sp. JEL0078]